MKFNKWTLGLAAVGAVSLTSAARADEAKIIPLQTTLANTTLSGYVDTAVQYNPGNVSSTGTRPVGVGAPDAFSFNDLDIAIDHPLDSTPWSAGYHVDLNYGAQAVGLPAGFTSGNTGDSYSAIRQAYVALSTPVGNGIQWKLGIQDDIIGYEGNTDSGNPNYTRSVGYDIEPTTLLGLVGSYQINSLITVQAGLAENYTTASYDAVGSDDAVGEVSSKSFVGAVALTAPDSWGWIKGGTLNAGVVINPYKGGADNYYAGLTMPTPWSPLKLGAAFDLRSFANGDGHANEQNDSGWVAGLYGNFQATDKLSFNLRGEYFDLSGEGNPYGNNADGPPTPVTAYGNGKGEELTATVQYNLWANVTSRAEIRWDHSDAGSPFGYGTSDSTLEANYYTLALNVIYSF